ncbi:MAG: hypothetical protein M3331_01770 [Actinomycetota bacterium]|nr:hypothetical protein [Actinomycetota bacterium]
MEGSEVQDDGETAQDPGLAEAPTGAPPVSEDQATDVAGKDTAPETDDQPSGAPETEGEDIEPEGGAASDTEETPDASGGSI